MIRLKAYAKINLFLEIVSREDNGYHLVNTVMQSISLSDSLSLCLLPEESGIEISCTDPSVPLDGRNICHKAATAFLDATGIKTGASINIEKNIPSCAGMGGGSADGAAVIVGLNQLCNTNLTVDELARIGASVGADVPFCIYGGTAKMDRYGDRLQSKLPTRELYFLIAKPQSGVSTPLAYKTLDEIYNGFCSYSPKDCSDLVSAIENNYISSIPSHLYNIFEQAMHVCNRDVVEILKLFRESGVASLLSGSGSAVFGVFENESDALNHLHLFKDKLRGCFLTVARAEDTGLSII